MLRREEQPCWCATCDRCGEWSIYEYGPIHYPDEATAQHELESILGWRISEDGHCLCPLCIDEEELERERGDKRRMEHLRRGTVRPRLVPADADEQQDDQA